MMPYLKRHKKQITNNGLNTFKRAIRAFRPYRVQVVLVLIAILLTALLELVDPLLISHVLDDAIQKRNAPLLLIYVAIMIVTPIILGIISMGQGYLNNRVGQNVMYDFRNQLYQRLQSMPLSFFTRTRTGEILSRLSNDVGGIQGIVTNTAINLLSNISTVLSIVIAMVFLSPLLTLVTLGLTPLFLWIASKVGNARRQVSRETQKSMATLTTLTEETLSVSEVLLVKVFGQQKYVQEQFKQENKKLADLMVQQLMVGLRFSTIVLIVFSVMPALVYLVAGEQIIYQLPILGEPMTLGSIVAFTLLQFTFFDSLRALLNLQIQTQGALALFERIFEYLDLPSDVIDKPDALHLIPEKVRGAVTFRNVTFRYKGNEHDTLTGFNEKGKPGKSKKVRLIPLKPNAVSDPQGEPSLALQNISFTIKPGQLVALVGPSGAGKTTITYMLPRLYDVESGVVEIDGINVKDIARASLSELIGEVTQENYLLHASIRENILYGRRDASEEEMIAAAQAAAIHDRILELEDGYDTIVGERG